jgi:hypothetical protein
LRGLRRALALRLIFVQIDFADQLIVAALESDFNIGSVA